MQVDNSYSNSQVNFKGIKTPRGIKCEVLKKVFDITANDSSVKRYADCCDLTFVEIPPRTAIGESRLGVHAGEIRDAAANAMFAREKHEYVSAPFMMQKKYNPAVYAMGMVEAVEKVAKKFLAGKTIVAPVESKHGAYARYKFDAGGDESYKEIITSSSSAVKEINKGYNPHSNYTGKAKEHLCRAQQEVYMPPSVNNALRAQYGEMYENTIEVPTDLDVQSANLSILNDRFKGF